MSYNPSILARQAQAVRNHGLDHLVEQLGAVGPKGAIIHVSTHDDEEGPHAQDVQAGFRKALLEAVVDQPPAELVVPILPRLLESVQAALQLARQLVPVLVELTPRLGESDPNLFRRRQQALGVRRDEVHALEDGAIHRRDGQEESETGRRDHWGVRQVEHRIPLAAAQHVRAVLHGSVALYLQCLAHAQDVDARCLEVLDRFAFLAERLALLQVVPLFLARRLAACLVFGGEIRDVGRFEWDIGHIDLLPPTSNARGRHRLQVGRSLLPPRGVESGSLDKVGVRHLQMLCVDFTPRPHCAHRLVDLVAPCPSVRVGCARVFVG